MFWLREIVVEPATIEYLDAEIANDPRLSEVYWALEWRLTRHPEAGFPLSGPNPPRFLIKSDPRFVPYGIPVLTLIYRYTDTQVTIEVAKVN